MRLAATSPTILELSARDRGTLPGAAASPVSSCRWLVGWGKRRACPREGFAVGAVATSFGASSTFSAPWDSLNVLPGPPDSERTARRPPDPAIGRKPGVRVPRVARPPVPLEAARRAVGQEPCPGWFALLRGRRAFRQPSSRRRRPRPDALFAASQRTRPRFSRAAPIPVAGEPVARGDEAASETAPVGRAGASAAAAGAWCSGVRYGCR